mgnify:CR=1 FL=1
MKCTSFDASDELRIAKNICIENMCKTWPQNICKTWPEKYFHAWRSFKKSRTRAWGFHGGGAAPGGPTGKGQTHHPERNGGGWTTIGRTSDAPWQVNFHGVSCSAWFFACSAVYKTNPDSKVAIVFLGTTRIKPWFKKLKNTTSTSCRKNNSKNQSAKTTWLKCKNRGVKITPVLYRIGIPNQ